MVYRAVGNRCAVDFEALALPIPRQAALQLLMAQSFEVVQVDLIAWARRCVGNCEWRRDALYREAPLVFNCSSFTKWLYSKRGIWIPRRAIQQREEGVAIEPDSISRDDLVFAKGRLSHFDVDPADNVGHAGIATGEGTIIHAASKIGIVESSVSSFIEGKF